MHPIFSALGIKANYDYVTLRYVLKKKIVKTRKGFLRKNIVAVLISR